MELHFRREIEYSALDTAVVLAIEDLSAPIDDRAAAKATTILVDICQLHPLVFLRHFPVYVKKLAHFIGRTKLRATASGTLPKDEILVAVGFGSKPSETCKVHISTATIAATRSSVLWATWIKCMRAVNAKSLNESIDSALRKFASSCGLFY
jgi:hypothetical protein